MVQDNPQAYPESRLHFGPSQAGTLSRDSCLRRLFLGHLLLGCTPPSSTSLYHHHPAKEETLLRRLGLFFKLGSGCLYTPLVTRLPTITTTTTTTGPVAHLFSPLLIFAGPQVDSNSQPPTCVVYARSLYHNIIQTSSTGRQL